MFKVSNNSMWVIRKKQPIDFQVFLFTSLWYLSPKLKDSQLLLKAPVSVSYKEKIPNSLALRATWPMFHYSTLMLYMKVAICKQGHGCVSIKFYLQRKWLNHEPQDTDSWASPWTFPFSQSADLLLWRRGERSAPPTVASAAPLLQQSGWLTLVRSVCGVPLSLVPLCVLVVGELLW